ncbi:putative ankyrin repeat-containing domain, PGG domain-containing protein [Rosa chinensis]|uniref:Putative ankyrin repeat-containing domain, PGG domain-containing protein n=1 Tax=Rosa chinensis TaxID=74649 RepID=A0A2P6QVB7_ROSCH|nr:protein ACCELERATED CELL DEATH 6 isoform X1 [Rosa chinensis]PRQ38111.1 putative ankyrin repeat-containing domain, PGG domain-containing protein [Rosa chinensis]
MGLETLRIRNRGNSTVLHEASRNGHYKVVEFLIKVDPNLASVENDEGESPLYLAARGGMLEIVNQIIRTNPSSAHGGSFGQTALHAAVVERHVGVMEALVAFKQELAKEADRQGRTPLYYAASLGDHRTVKRLLELDTSTAYVLDKGGRSPIHVAARNGHTGVIREIIQHCPDSGELIDPYGQNALHIAISSGQANVVTYILETPELEGLINQSDIDGNTPLHLAAIARKTWILWYLMWDGRVNQRSKNKYGQTAFDSDRSIKESSITSSMISARADHEEAISAMQTYKKTGQTLLMVATLITTVTFTAVFTMPGGYNNDAGSSDRGLALLQSSENLKSFIVSDTVAMTCSISAACLLFWGAVNSKECYLYYFTSAAALTYIALQSTAIAFTTGIRDVLPHQQFVHTMGLGVEVAFHISTFLFLSQLVKTFSIPEACRLLFSHLRIKSKRAKRENWRNTCLKLCLAS